MLFSDGTRTALVISSLLTLFPIGIISLVFWILVSTQLRWQQGGREIQFKIVHNGNHASNAKNFN